MSANYLDDCSVCVFLKWFTLLRPQRYNIFLNCTNKNAICAILHKENMAKLSNSLREDCSRCRIVAVSLPYLSGNIQGNYIGKHTECVKSLYTQL